MEKPQLKGWDWWIGVNDPKKIWELQPTYLLSEWSYYFFALMTFLHSQRVGGRFRWLWLATVLHGLFLENVTFWTPQIDNFWHSQTTVMLFGRRLPLHILCLYPSFIYTSSVLVSRLKLNRISEACAVGLCTVLIDIPYDIMAVKFVHWTWHDTDPNIYDRHYWVPWTSYYFHATFAFSFTYAFHFWRRRFCDSRKKKWVSDQRFSRELLSTVCTAFCGMPGGIVQFVLLYHPLHDHFGIHTENCVFSLFVLYGVIIIAGALMKNSPIKRTGNIVGSTFRLNEISIALLQHYTLYLCMAVFGNPEKEISIGLHETIGNCDEVVEMPTAFTLVTGKMARRRKFLCATDYDEKYFDFHCHPQKFNQNDKEWYQICGTPYESRPEYIQVLATIVIGAFVLFGTILSTTEQINPSKNTKTSKKTN